MSFASEKLYNGYLRRKMPTIVSSVKVREIVIHLPCLTAHDRENIEAKREVCGNYDGMVLLLDCLKRRENWPEQFIEALEACEQPTIAAEIRAEYNALKGMNNSNPSSPPTTVVRAHVHPAPSASHLSTPESSDNIQAAVAPPAEAPPTPPEPATQAPPPVETSAQPQAPQTAEDQAPKDVSPLEPVPEPLQSTQIEVPPPPSTPPPSPETPHTLVTTSPLPQREINSHQEPEENSEPGIQGISCDADATPDEVSTGNGEVSVDPVTTPQPHHPEEHSQTDTRSDPEPLQTTITAEDRPPRSPSPTEINPDVTTGSSFPIVTPEKFPVQDTAPPVDKITTPVLQPEETSEPPTIQVVESGPQTETTGTASPEAGAAEMNSCLSDDNTQCLSKPAQLISIQPQDNDSPTIAAYSSPVDPYSGDSERLEISEAAPDAVPSAYVLACCAVSSTIENTVTALPCQENGIAPNYNEPEENHYESPSQSLEMQEVLVNVVKVSEEPSIPNLDGQTSTPHVQVINGEAAKDITSAPLSTNAAEDTESGFDTPSSESCRPSEAELADGSPEMKTLRNAEDKEARQTPLTWSTNTKYILSAVGVGACALLMAWRFKN